MCLLNSQRMFADVYNLFYPLTFNSIEAAWSFELNIGVRIPGESKT